MEPIERLALANGLTMEIHDKSRAVAEDTFRVTLIIRIPVEVRPDYFADREGYELTRRVFGPVVVFEYRKDKNFVPSGSRHAAFQELFNDFKSAALEYVSRPRFPAGFVLSKYAEILKNPYRYGPA